MLKVYQASALQTLIVPSLINLSLPSSSSGPLLSSPLDCYLFGSPLNLCIAKSNRKSFSTFIHTYNSTGLFTNHSTNYPRPHLIHFSLSLPWVFPTRWRDANNYDRISLPSTAAASNRSSFPIDFCYDPFSHSPD